MEELGIILIVVFCVLTLGLGVLLGFYMRAVLLNSRRQTPVQVLVKIPPVVHYFCISKVHCINVCDCRAVDLLDC